MIRYLVLIFVFVLYFFPVYERYIKSPVNIPYKRIVAETDSPYVSPVSRPYYREDFVFRQKPGSASISHVSSITPAGEGKMVCTWYAGSREGARDVSIYVAVYNEKEQIWSEPVILVSREQASRELNRYVKKLGNAVIFRDIKGRLWLFYASVAVGGWSGTSINYKVSHDEGQTWTESRKMILSPFLNLTNNVKNKGLSLDDGSFLLPVYHEFMRKYSQIIRVRPEGPGAYYEIRKITHGKKAIQPSLLADGKEQLKAFFRNMGTREKEYILTADSNDLGMSWNELKETPLPNPDSGFDMIRLESGAFLGIINDSFDERDNLTMVISHDSGETWSQIMVLEDAEGKEYSYPSVSRSMQGKYHLTYTYNRELIKHVVFNEAWIRKTEETGN